MAQNNGANDNAQAALIALMGALEARDSFTKNHSVRVSQIAVRLGKIFKLDESTLNQIANASLLHDIGMVSVPDAILLKPAPFTELERKIIRDAPNVAARILEPIPSLKNERLMVLHHGERWDGKGYPDGLKGEAIPLGARLIAVAEAIDAMTQNRTYRRTRPLSYCLEQLELHAGSQFDPKIAKIAIAALCKGQFKSKADT